MHRPTFLNVTLKSRSKDEQGLGSDRLQGKSRLRLSENMLFLAGRRAAVPLWPVVCPVPQGGGAVIGLCHADVALGSALDSAEELWHPSPKGANTHRSLPGGSDRRLRGRISPRKSDKFGVAGKKEQCSCSYAEKHCSGWMYFSWRLGVKGRGLTPRSARRPAGSRGWPACRCGRWAVSGPAGFRGSSRAAGRGPGI